MNNLSLIGRLTKEYEVRQLSSGKSVGSLTLAVETGWGDNKHTSFFDVAVFGKQVDAHAQYIRKGSKIAILGSIRQERWEGQDGTKRSKIKVVADRIEYLDGKPAGAGNVSEEEPPF